MFKRLFLSLFAVGFLASGAAFAHSDHVHEPIGESKAIANAKTVVSKMVKKGKLDASWNSVTSVNASKKKFKEEEEWLITFKNTAVKDLAKSTLYVFLSLSGEYLAANYTGK